MPVSPVWLLLRYVLIRLYGVSPRAESAESAVRESCSPFVACVSRALVWPRALVQPKMNSLVRVFVHGAGSTCVLRVYGRYGRTHVCGLRFRIGGVAGGHAGASSRGHPRKHHHQ